MTGRTRAAARRPSSWWGVIGVVAVLLTLSGGLAALLPSSPGPDTVREVAAAVGLALMFGVAETFVLHVQVKREAQTVALSEIPLVLGLTFTAPHSLVVGMTVGATAAYVLHRRQRGIKLVYNVTLKLTDALVAVTVYGAVLGSADSLGWRWLVACYLTVVTVALLDGLTTQLVIGLHDGSLGRQAAADILVYPAVAVAVSTVAVVVCFAIDRSATAVVPAAAAGVFLVVGYRAYSRLNDRHLSLERLYQFSQAVTGTPEVDETLQHVLSQAKDLLKSEHAEISFFSGNDETLVRVALSPSGRLLRENARPEPDEPTTAAFSDAAQPVMMTRGTRDAQQRSYLTKRRWREAIVVPLHGDAGVIGALAVADRMGEVRSFHSGDMRLLETVANHAGMALQNSRLIDRLRHESLHDALTGLPNRVLLRNEASDQLSALAHGRSPGAAMMIMDLDGFKDVNDTLGHQHGDELLKVVAARTVEAAGPSCTVARLGGDEFALLVRDCSSSATAHAVATRVLTTLRTPTELDGVPVQVGASIGVSLAPEHATDVTALLRFADVAMYAAKTSGGGVKLYEADSDTSSPDRLALITELREAVDLGGVDIHVQPKADLRTGRVDSVEVLARWEHPRHGLLGPDQFIDLVERAGLIQPLTEHVLRRAMRHCATWRAAGHDINIAVNLSPRSLAEPTLCADIGGLLAEHNLPAELLTLEITEGTVMADPAEAIRVLQQLRDLGVLLSVDDFGVGYSSLSNLSRLPVHELKIDRGFVVGTADRSRNAVIIRSIVDLGRNLALDVVAEGVESFETWDWLRTIGCHHAQGYWIGRPMPPDALLGWLDRWRRRADELIDPDHQPAVPALSGAPGASSVPTGAH